VKTGGGCRNPHPAVEPSNFSNEKALVGGEEFGRARKAGNAQAADHEICVTQFECPRIPVRPAGDLAEHPILTIGTRQNNGWPQLGLRQIGKWKRHQHYRSD
jgi:hypothetical protein